LRVQRYNLYFN